MAKKGRSSKSKSTNVATRNTEVESAKAAQRSKVTKALGDSSYSEFEATAYKGPVPAPEDLGLYENLLPGSADRLISMAEREATHRHQVEMKLVDAAVSDKTREQDYLNRGQVFAFILALGAIGAGVYLASTGIPEWGTMLGLSGVAVLIWPFINRFRGRDKD